MDQKQIISLVGVGVVSAGVGATVSHILTKKKYTAIADAEIEAVRDSYRILRKEGPLATPESAAEHLTELREAETKVEEYTEKLEELGYIKEVTDEDMEDNALEGAEPLKVGDKVGRYTVTDRVIPAAIEPPSETEPYVIREEEFMEGFENHGQVLLSYYPDDKTLCDESQVEVEDKDAIVGRTALGKFGQGSNDPRIVYVRNRKSETDYEITLMQGSYGHEVLGFDKTEMPRKTKKRNDG